MNQDNTKVKTGVIYYANLERLDDTDEPIFEIEEVIDFCELNNFSIGEIYSDYGPGDYTRHELRKALDFIENNDVDYFVCYDIIRASRNIYDLLVIHKRLCNAGTQLMSLHNMGIQDCTFSSTNSIVHVLS